MSTQLEQEYKRRDVVNSRLTATVTSATGLLTLTIAATAVLRGKDFTFSGVAFVALLISLFAFLAAAGCGVVGSLNWAYKVIKIATLQSMITTHWRDSAQASRGVVAYVNVQTINTLRRGTNIKYKLLHGAGLLQLVAIAALGVSAGFSTL